MRMERRMTTSNGEPRAILAGDREPTYLARRLPGNRHRNEMLGAPLRRAFDQHLARFADL